MKTFEETSRHGDYVEGVMTYDNGVADRVTITVNEAKAISIRGNTLATFRQT